MRHTRNPGAGLPIGVTGERGLTRVDFRDYLKDRCRDRGISLHRLALLCDLNQIYFYQAVNKNKENPPPWVLRRAAPHLGVNYVELLIAAGYITEDELSEWVGRGAGTGALQTASVARS